MHAVASRRLGVDDLLTLIPHASWRSRLSVPRRRGAREQGGPGRALGGFPSLRARWWLVTGLVPVGLLWRGFRPRRVVVVGGSMRPSLEPGDRLLIVAHRRPRPGDVVALADPREPGRLLVKRVAARLPPAHLEVRGDAPSASTDSRQFGPVPERAVLGVAVYRYAPAERRGKLASKPRGAGV